MGVFADRIATMTLRQSTPDGFIEGTLTKAEGLSVAFTERTYGHYTERGLESQLNTLCAQLRAEYQRYTAEALAAATGRPVDLYARPGRDPDARGHRLELERAATVLKGMSSRAMVYIEATGMERWRVLVRDGALDALTEAEFTRELAEAYQAVLDDDEETMHALRDKHYEN